MRKTFNFILLAAIGVTVLLTLTSCGSSSAKSESDILTDIQREDSFFLDYNLNIDSSAITKRQTNSDSKTDYVWVELTASNEDFTRHSEYILTYILYNDGWMLEEYEQTNGDISPNWYPDALDARADFDTYCSDYTFAGEVDRGERYITYQATYSLDYLYLITEYEATMKYTFAPQTGWTGEFSKDETGHSLDIVGKWEYKDNKRNYYVDVISVGSEWIKDDLWGYYTTYVKISFM